MKRENNLLFRIGKCGYTNRDVLQYFDGKSDDADDEFGWFCLHDDTIEEELINIYKFQNEIRKFN